MPPGSGSQPASPGVAGVRYSVVRFSVQRLVAVAGESPVTDPAASPKRDEQALGGIEGKMPLQVVLQLERNPYHERRCPEIPPEPPHFKPEQPAQNHHHENRIQHDARIPAGRNRAPQEQGRDHQHGRSFTVGRMQFGFQLAVDDQIPKHAEHVPHGLEQKFPRMTGQRAAQKTARQPANAITRMPNARIRRTESPTPAIPANTTNHESTPTPRRAAG